jgi:signal transduction histidine kinase
VRGDVRLEQQREKLMALGKLSAGLAHELNNPAAAVRRTAAGLATRLEAQRDRVLRLLRGGGDAASIDAVEKLRQELRERQAPKLTSLEESEREEAILDWLEERDVDEAWELAPAFMAAGVTDEDLERCSAEIAPGLLPDAIAWLGGGLAADRMAAEIDASAVRISDLISSVKSYSQMDRSPEHKPTDIHAGLESTLMMYAHALAGKNVRVRRSYSESLPEVTANPGELNQVWSNLIDNAIDAMSQGGELVVETDLDEWNAMVRIVDDGSGIPDEVRSRIFEPFFTTTDVGEGTGLGLDIALRIVRLHRGQIEVESRPGRTAMTVCLPIDASAPPESGGQPGPDAGG